MLRRGARGLVHSEVGSATTLPPLVALGGIGPLAIKPVCKAFLLLLLVHFYQSPTKSKQVP